MAKTRYYDSAFGIALYPHLNAADSKFHPDNPVFKTKLILKGDAAQAMKARVDGELDAAFTAFLEDPEQGGKLSPADRKKWSKHPPYVEEEDDQGNLTGRIVFEFKQNERIRLKDGTVKNIVIGLYDAAGKEMHKLVTGGSEIRVNYSMRAYPIKATKQIGLRLDFGRVQVKTLAERSSGGFGAVEGYVDDGEPEESGGFGAVGDSGSADY